MRRFHNPRFAPESLERKLSPSGLVASPIAAEVYVPASKPAADTTTIPDGDGDPPLDTPIIPNGPTQPA